MLPIQPQFLEGGRTVLLAHVLGGEKLAIHDTSTGSPLSAIPCDLQITGLAVSSTQAAYIWSTTTVEEIDLTSGQVLRTLRP